MEGKEETKYVFNEVEDVENLEADELKKYAKELQVRLANEKSNVKMYQNWWYEEKQKVDTIKADVESLKKITNLMVEKW